MLFSHLCKTIFTVQYIVYGIFLDISQIITTRYTILLSCHQKKMLKIEHLLQTKLLFEISMYLANCARNWDLYNGYCQFLIELVVSILLDGKSHGCHVKFNYWSG